MRVDRPSILHVTEIGKIKFSGSAMQKCNETELGFTEKVVSETADIMRDLRLASSRLSELKKTVESQEVGLSSSIYELGASLREVHLRIDEIKRDSESPSKCPHRSQVPIVDGTETLLDRLIGEDKLHRVLNKVFGTFLKDTRVRAFYENTSVKMRVHKDKLYRCLLGLLTGDSKVYDMTNLKPAHYHLNITDYHFDAFLDIFRSVLDADTELTPLVTSEVMSKLANVRSDITSGYTVRCELARINTAHDDTNSSTLMKKIGGLEGVITFIDELYKLIEQDSRIAQYFVGHNFEKIRRGQRAYITELIGGPKMYRGRTMEEIHLNLGITDYLFDCYVHDAQKALRKCGSSDAVIDQVLIQLESVRASVVGHQRGAAEIYHVSNPYISNNTFGTNLSSMSRMSGTSSNNSPSASYVQFASAGTSGSRQSLLTHLGGELVVRQYVSTLFDVCAQDELLKDFFDLTNTPRRSRFEIGFYQCLITVSGGTVMYDLTQLRDSHYNLDITDSMFDRFMNNLQITILKENPRVEEIFASALINRLSKLRSEITAGFTIRSHLDKSSSVPPSPLVCPFAGSPS